MAATTTKTAAKQPAASSTALAVAPQNESTALAEAFDFDFDATGLEEADAEDLRFAVKVWNLKGKKPGGAPGEMIQINEFFDTLTEKTSKTLTCVFVTLTKSHDYSYFDEATQETVRVCTSYDRVTGRTRAQHPSLPQVKEGTERSCETCPDGQWTKGPKGNNVKNCATVYGVIGIELSETGEEKAPYQLGSPFMIRFKRTSLNPFKTHMQKHHLKRRQDPKTKQMVDVPLFAFAVSMYLEPAEKGTHAVPVINRGDILPRDLLMVLAEQAKSFRDMAVDVTRAAEKKESAHNVDAIDTEGHSGPAATQNDFADV